MPIFHKRESPAIQWNNEGVPDWDFNLIVTHHNYVNYHYKGEHHPLLPGICVWALEALPFCGTVASIVETLCWGLDVIPFTKYACF